MAYKEKQMTITDLGECIKPVTYMKTNAVDMMSFVNDRKEPMIITQDGESRAVLMDIESYEEMKNAFNMLKMIQISDKDVAAGRTKNANQVFAELRSKYLHNGD